MSSALIADGRTWPLAFDLYLPTAWTDDPARCAAAGIPPTVRFREKWRIALAQVRIVLQAGFTITGVVVAADYGASAAFRAGLERLGPRLRCRDPRRGDVHRHGRAGAAVGHRAGRLRARRRVGDGHVGHGHGWPVDRRVLRAARAPDDRPGRSLAALRALGHGRPQVLPAPSAGDHAARRPSWPIEQQYRELKDDLGLDHFEGRTYQGWTHHAVLTAVAFTFLQIERARPTDGPRPTLPVMRGWVREIMGLLYVLHNRRLLGMLDSLRRHPPLRR